MKNDFLIKFTVYGHRKRWFFWHEVLKKGSMRCRNRDSEQQAKAGLQQHLMKLYPTMHHVEFGEIINETKVNADADFLHLVKVHSEMSRAARTTISGRR